MGYGGKSTLPACPDADGLIPGQITQDLSFLKGERFRLGPAKFGSYSQSTKVKARVVIRGTLGPDAKLASILYDFQESFEIAHSGNALGFLQASWVAGVTVKAKGKLDPKTGQPIGGSSTITPRAVSAAALRGRAGGALEGDGRARRQAPARGAGRHPQAPARGRDQRADARQVRDDRGQPGAVVVAARRLHDVRHARR